MAIHSTTPTLGVALARTVEVSTTDPSIPAPPHEPGMRVTGQDNSEWVFVQAAANVTAGFVCQIGLDFTVAHITTANSVFNRQVGIPQVDIASGDYGWVQTKGIAAVGARVLADAAANVTLNTTATAGALDDDGGTGAKDIVGLTITTAAGGAAATQPAILTWPSVGATN